MFDPTDIQAVNAAEESQRQLRLAEAVELDDTIESVMQTREGRRFVWHLLDRSGCNGSTFDPNPYIAAFQEGRRRVGLELQNVLYARCPALYDAMLRERVVDQEKRKKEIA